MLTWVLLTDYEAKVAPQKYNPHRAKSITAWRLHDRHEV